MQFSYNTCYTFINSPNAESLRVLKFRESAAQKDGISDLSYLMRQSHKSLKELYECSHPNLDRLIDISDKFGVSARLTGAG